MNRIYEVRFLKPVRKLTDGEAEVAEGFAEALAPVSGDQNKPRVTWNLSQRPGRPVVRPVRYLQEGVYHRVAGNKNRGIRVAFGQKGLPRKLGGAEVEVREGVREDAVHLFRERAPLVSSTQPGLYVTEAHVVIVGNERGG